MGVSPACVAAVREASGQRLDEAEAAQLIGRMEAQRKALEAAGEVDNLDARLRALAAEDARQARIAAALGKKHAALAAIAYDRTLRQVGALVAGGLDRRQALLAVLEGTTRNVEGGRASVAFAARAFQARYMERFNLAVTRDPELARLVERGDPAFAADVVREMRELREGGTPGRTGDPKAQQLAKLYADIAETARRDLNALGAPIGRLDGWSPQSHSSDRVLRASFEEWRDFILPRLDRERTFGDIADARVEAALRDIHRAIITGVDRRALNAQPTERLGPANLASSLARARTLHFADADGWLAYAARFGNGTVHDAMLAHLTMASKAAGQMQVLGPNPEATLTRLRGQLMRDAALDPTLAPRQRQKQVDALNPANDAGTLGSAWAEVSGLTAIPASERVAQIGTALRAWQSLAKLGGAVLSSAPDLVVRAHALTVQGRPMAAAWAESIGQVFQGRGRGEQREIAALLDAGLDGIRNQVTGAGLAEDMPLGWAHKATAFFFRWQGMTWWADSLKAGSARMLSRWMGMNSALPFDQLGGRYQAVLRQQGISAPEWDVIRATAWQAQDGNRYVTPDRVAGLPLTTQGLGGLAQEALDALDQGLAARVARRTARDTEEAAWVKRRADALADGFQRQVANLKRVNAQADAGTQRRVGKLRERMDLLALRLSELAEFRQAEAEGRSWTPAAEEPDPDADVLAWRAGEPLPADIVEAEAEAARLKGLGITQAITTPERRALRAAAIERVTERRLAEIGGEPALERQALIVIGPPSAGKSTVIEPLARQMRALLVDSDDLKAELPEFEGGLGAGRVHDESSGLASEMRMQAIRQGANIAVPTVGDKPAILRQTITDLKAAGYRVTLVLNSLPIERAAQRNMQRFRATGRLVEHEYLMRVGSLPDQAYLELRELADEHAHYSNDVPRGDAPRYQGGTRDFRAADTGTAGDGPGQQGTGAAEPGPAAPRAGAPGGGAEGGGVAPPPTSSNTSLSGTAPTEGGRTFAPRSERYLEAGDPATLAARAEGELRGRLDALRRAIGAVNREAGMAGKDRLAGVLSWWNARQGELDAFTAEVEGRAAARAEATAAEHGQWNERVARVLEERRLALELKLRRFYADEMGFAALESDAATRRLTLQGTRPGTVTGELMRAIAQFKGYPVAFTQRVLGRAVQGYGPGERAMQARHLGTLLGGLMVMGYVSMTAKDIGRGWGPRDPTKLDTILAAFLQSGGAGIYGDFLFASANRFGNSALETAVGPLPATIGAAINLAATARDGEMKPAKALNLVLGNTPFLSLWYVRPTLDFLVLNSLREALSPGFIARQERNRAEDFGQERLIPASLF